jgi:hypothetical protein
LPLDIPDVGLKNVVPFYMKSSSASDIAALIGKQYVFVDYVNQSGFLAAGLLSRNPSAGFAAITRYRKSRFTPLSLRLQARWVAGGASHHRRQPSIE